MKLDKLSELSNKEIKNFIETTPLYTWKEFKKTNRTSLQIDEIDSFCKTCDQIRPFHDMRPRGSGAGMAIQPLSSGTTNFYFTCVSCKKEYLLCNVEQVIDNQTIKIQKFGELPRKAIDRDKLLKKFFSNDSDNYEKAVVCLSHGYGVAAFAYFRRIIENNIIKLLDMIQEDSSSLANSQEIKEALDNLRKESPMSNKIEIANNALPEYLKPDGLNPLGRLYKILSEGVHNLNDQECLSRANIVQECLKFLISELSTRKTNSDRFKKLVGSLN
ncbi:MAG: hypothetical protein E6Q83_08965 [Thiothrix sp.]|nr:MAG: hypothetical protein E6Q83_08965 [Thiothrix sp.]